MIRVRMGFKNHAGVLEFDTQSFAIKIHPVTGVRTYEWDNANVAVKLRDIDVDSVAWVTTLENPEPF